MQHEFGKDVMVRTAPAFFDENGGLGYTIAGDLKANKTSHPTGVGRTMWATPAKNKIDHKGDTWNGRTI